MKATIVKHTYSYGANALNGILKEMAAKLPTRLISSFIRRTDLQPRGVQPPSQTNQTKVEKPAAPVWPCGSPWHRSSVAIPRKTKQAESCPPPLDSSSVLSCSTLLLFFQITICSNNSILSAFSAGLIVFTVGHFCLYPVGPPPAPRFPIRVIASTLEIGVSDIRANDFRNQHLSLLPSRNLIS